MHIELTNVFARLASSTPEETEWANQFLAIKTAKFERNYQTRRVEYGGIAVEHLLDMAEKTFLTGLVPQLLKSARAAGMTVTVSDLRVRPCEPDPSADLRWLRDYQLAGVHKMLQVGRGIMEAATGSGKTDMYTGITRALPCRHGFFVHRSNLVRDAAARIRLRAQEHGHEEPDIGIIGDGLEEFGHRFTLMTSQGIAMRLREPKIRALLAGLECVTIDECHGTASRSSQKILMACPNAYYRFGLSGTALSRSDGKGAYTIGALGPIYYKVTAKELIGRGVLAQPIIRFMKYSAPEIYSAGYPEARKQGINECAQRNAVIVEATRTGPTPAIVFVEASSHGKHLTKLLRAAGMNAEFVWGAKNTKFRQATAEKLARGEIDVIVASKVFSEGLDIPVLEHVVRAAGGQADVRSLQELGRGMRVTETKKDFLVTDFEDAQHPILLKHTGARRAAYRREGHKVTSDVSLLGLSLDL